MRVNWTASLANTNWQQAVWTGQYDQANAGVGFFLDFDGKCWLDNVSVRKTGTSTEILTNGTFESGTNHWLLKENHKLSRAEAGMGYSNSTALALVCNMTRWLGLPEPIYVLEAFGDSISNYVVSAPLNLATGDQFVVSYWVRREGVSDHLCSYVGSASNVVWLGNRGTPGRANTVTADGMPLGILDLTKQYKICPVGIANVIRARLEPRAAVSNVWLRYRTIATNTYEFSDGYYSALPMKDDGVVPDTTAGDGEYAVAMPAFVTNDLIIRYHVLAAATNGATARWPHLDDPSMDEGYWVQAASVQTILPNWYIRLDGGPELYPITARACAVSSDGQVFTDIMMRQRGNPIRNLTHSGYALRIPQGRSLDTWFAKNQDGINFVSRLNDYWRNWARIINQPLAYDLQRLIGLATPRYRYACQWINGVPSITMELEDPDNAYLTANGFSVNDYVTRFSFSGRKAIGDCNPALDNLGGVQVTLEAATNSTKTAVIRTMLNYESIQHSQALVMLTANSDQWFLWNMIDRRSAADGRWSQHPWDVDVSFNEQYTTNTLHPYYKTLAHPDSSGAERLLASRLFYPESGTDAEYSLPYRHRHQMTLWRYCHTLLTTNYLFPRLDAMQQELTPAFVQLGLPITGLTNQVALCKTFIANRRDFLMNGVWSDKNTNIWQAGNVYNPSTIVINEIMADPDSGGEYLELYNRGTQSVDLSWWLLSAGNEAYHLPHGTMLGPTSYLVVADRELSLTNAYSELGDAGSMIERFPGQQLWDWPIVWTSAMEYATRVVEISNITLSAAGAALVLRDVQSNVIDAVTYSNLPPWPLAQGVSLELIDPAVDNAQPTNWRSCTVVGTPGRANAAALDTDGDAMPDSWEQKIIAASGGLFTTVAQVLPDADFDGDGLPNLREFILGTDPTVRDDAAAALDIHAPTGKVTVGWRTFASTGTAYQLYRGRYYTLENSTNLPDPNGWQPIPGYIERAASGTNMVYTNTAPAVPAEMYRGRIRLQPVRP
jgi:hypothetical protein